MQLIIIIESIYLFQDPILDYLDYKIFLDISKEEALQRATSRKRDLELYKNKDGIIKKYTTKNFAGYKLFDEMYDPKSKADVVINNNDWKNPVIIKGTL